MEPLFIFAGFGIFISLLVCYVLDVIDRRRRVSHTTTIINNNPRSDMKQASVYGAGAYALYYFAKDAPEETWFVSYFVFTWKYIGGIFGFILAIPITLLTFFLRFFFGRRT